MLKDSLIEFKETVDEEIKEYEAMEDLYKLKQAVLVQCKTDALWDVDAKIVIRMDKIKKLNSKRKEVGKFLGNENITMTEVIEKAKVSNDKLAENLQIQKNKLNILAKSLSLYEKTNMELIKHGLTMVGKTLNIIVNALLPQPSQYNNMGKNVKNEKLQIGSVSEEA